MSGPFWLWFAAKCTISVPGKLLEVELSPRYMLSPMRLISVAVFLRKSFITHCQKQYKFNKSDDGRDKSPEEDQIDYS
jgi:hypothetical protein